MLAVLTGLGLSAAAGLNAYIPMLVVGLLGRHTDLVRLPAEFEWLTNGWVLAILGVLLAAEVVLDKVAVVDSLNDAVQTAVRPAAGGAVFAATDAAGRLDSSASMTEFMADHPWIGWILGIVVALVVHLTKTSLRPVVNAGTLGTGAPVVSTVEDTVSLGMSVLAVLAPVIALIGVIMLAFVSFRMLRAFRRRRRRRTEPTRA
ncbi:DUF4126 domain-containing protein [Actinomadura rudentiformis]|uniref:DUF4126 domain-containing protein n=1 Tax=Actinomadura rudentiformis TaxID=359158 RepID=A0A6H9YJ33_9ACTN|nr:DUF4126 domain-containing protein [Actinomadura rudentiformis]KAB2342693.1 DUF4126 domain-containing protein [Actinomadura rudentiformis]